MWQKTYLRFVCLVTVGIIETCTFNMKEEGNRICICCKDSYNVSDRGGHEWVCFVTVYFCGLYADCGRSGQ